MQRPHGVAFKLENLVLLLGLVLVLTQRLEELFELAFVRRLVVHKLHFLEIHETEISAPAENRGVSEDRHAHHLVQIHTDSVDLLEIVEIENHYKSVPSGADQIFVVFDQMQKGDDFAVDAWEDFVLFGVDVFFYDFPVGIFFDAAAGDPTRVGVDHQIVFFFAEVAAFGAVLAGFEGGVGVEAVDSEALDRAVDHFVLWVLEYGGKLFGFGYTGVFSIKYFGY